MRSLSNQYLTIRVADHGAELSGIVANATGKEYLWQADPAFWKRHSPVLFPIVGSVWEGKYRQDGATYSLSQHGFARDRDFTLVHDVSPSRAMSGPARFILSISAWRSAIAWRATGSRCSGEW